MLLAIAGITGIGKSYYKDRIMEKLGFEKIKIITTREPRAGEKNNDDKVFVSEEELAEFEKNGEIAYKFELLGNYYAYTNDELFSEKNTVFEMHYWTVEDFKRICPDIKVIYLLLRDIEEAKEKLRARHLKPEVEEARIKEIEEHYDRYMSDEKLRSCFDYVLYNDYDADSEEKVLNLVKEMMEND